MPVFIDVEFGSDSSSDSELLQFLTPNNVFNLYPAWRLYLMWTLLSTLCWF